MISYYFQLFISTYVLDHPESIDMICISKLRKLFFWCSLKPIFPLQNNADMTAKYGVFSLTPSLAYNENSKMLPKLHAPQLEPLMEHIKT